MKFEKSRIVTWLLLLFIACVLFNIYVLVKDRNQIYNNIEGSLQNVKDGNNGSDGKEGYTPIKGIDYFDGSKGDKGDSVVGPQGNAGESITGPQGATGGQGPAGQNGLTPQIRCNTNKNRWEVRYSETDNWEVMNGEKVKCMGGL